MCSIAKNLVLANRPTELALLLRKPPLRGSLSALLAMSLKGLHKRYRFISVYRSLQNDVFFFFFLPRMFGTNFASLYLSAACVPVFGAPIRVGSGRPQRLGEGVLGRYRIFSVISTSFFSSIAVPKVRGVLRSEKPILLPPSTFFRGHVSMRRAQGIMFHLANITKKNLVQTVNPPLADTQSPALPFESIVPLKSPLSISPSRSCSVPLKGFVIENFLNYLATTSTWGRFHCFLIHLQGLLRKGVA